MNDYQKNVLIKAKTYITERLAKGFYKISSNIDKTCVLFAGDTSLFLHIHPLTHLMNISNFYVWFHTNKLSLNNFLLMLCSHQKERNTVLIKQKQR